MKSREIANPCKSYFHRYEKECFSINYYHDENLCKGFIVCGFYLYIKILTLSGEWLPVEFEIEGNVTSLEIFSRKENRKNVIETKYYLFVSGCLEKTGIIKFIDLSNYTVISNISIPNANYYNDIAIWNSNFEKETALIAANKENSIKILINFKELKVLNFFKSTGLFKPVNLRKVLIKDKTTGTFKEHVIILQMEDQNLNQILLF